MKHRIWRCCTFKIKHKIDPCLFSVHFKDTISTKFVFHSFFSRNVKWRCLLKLYSSSSTWSILPSLMKKNYIFYIFRFSRSKSMVSKWNLIFSWNDCETKTEKHVQMVIAYNKIIHLHPLRVIMFNTPTRQFECTREKSPVGRLKVHWSFVRAN